MADLVLEWVQKVLFKVESLARLANGVFVVVCEVFVFENFNLTVDLLHVDKEWNVMEVVIVIIEADSDQVRILTIKNDAFFS